MASTGSQSIWSALGGIRSTASVPVNAYKNNLASNHIMPNWKHSRWVPFSFINFIQIPFAIFSTFSSIECGYTQLNTSIFSFFIEFMSRLLNGISFVARIIICYLFFYDWNLCVVVRYIRASFKSIVLRCVDAAEPGHGARIIWESHFGD